MDLSNKQITILYRIVETTPYGAYTDSLYFTPDAWAALSQDDLDKAVANRVSMWQSTILAPPEPPRIPNKEGA